MMLPISPLAGFFSIPPRAYENFTLSYNAAQTLTALVIAICAGVIFAALYNFYICRVPGSVVRLLLSRNATSPENALSAEELGLLNKPFSLWELLRGTALRRIVAIAPDKTLLVQEEPPESADQQDITPEAEEQSALSDAQEISDTEVQQNAAPEPPAEPEITAKSRFYIPEDKKYRAEIRFAEKGNGPMGLAITCALSVVLGIVLLKLIPIVLTMIDFFM